MRLLRLRQKEFFTMKRIDAVVRPDKVDAIKTSLQDLGITGLTVFEARGFGRQKGHTETYRGSEYSIDFLPKLFVSLVVADDLLEPALTAITESARTGQIGDGKIFVTSVDEVIRIRTGERGPIAI
jgi:nitrogen regulatory protein P-II 1